MNIVEQVALRAMVVLPHLTAEPLLRPLQTKDPSRSLGIFPVDWAVEERSMQIGSPVPALQRYNFRLHSLVKHTNEQEGRAIYANDSKKLRVMLYHDPVLRVALAQLIEQAPDHTERLMRFGVRAQRFLNNEISGQFIFLSSTEFWAETEVTHLGGV